MSSRTAMVPMSARAACTSASAFIDLVGRVGADREGQVVLAEGRPAGRDIVLGVSSSPRRLSASSSAERIRRSARFIRDSAAWRSTKPKRLRDGQLERQAQQLVEHAGRGLAGIVLDRDDADECRGLAPARPSSIASCPKLTRR